MEACLIISSAAHAALQLHQLQLTLVNGLVKEVLVAAGWLLWLLLRRGECWRCVSDVSIWGDITSAR